MGILARFRKQPAEVRDYDISYAEVLTALGDTASSVQTIVDPGITLVSSTITSGVVKVMLSGGTSGERYKITTRLTTTANRVLEADIIVSVRDY